MAHKPLLEDQSTSWASKARRHYREYLPGTYGEIDDKDLFFAELGRQAMTQIEVTYRALRRPELAYDMAAVKMAEETVRDFVYPDPETGHEEGWEIYICETDEEYEALEDLRGQAGY